jgi:hypothetical protein
MHKFNPNAYEINQYKRPKFREALDDDTSENTNRAFQREPPEI